MTEEIEKYVLAHSAPEGDYLYRLYRATNIHTIHGRMASGHLQGRLLKMLVSMIRPKNILEVGTFSGYSAICMAEGLDEGGKVWTFEINDEMEDFTRPWIENSPVADKIDFRRGDAWHPVRIGRSYYNSLNQLAIEVYRTADDDIEHNFEFGKPVCFFHTDEATGKVSVKQG